MNPNASKNRKLLRQYPFVSDILLEQMEPYDGRNGSDVHDLTIRVEKADGDLMFRSAKNVGLGDSTCIFQFKSNRNDRVMRRGEYLFAIDSNGTIINRVNWPRNDEEKRGAGEIYGWSSLWKRRILLANNTKSYTDPICDKVKYLVWVTVEAWHIDTRNDDFPGSRFGTFKDRSVHITIYGVPNQGFAKLQRESSVYTNLTLDSRVMTRGVAEKDLAIVSIGGMLHEICVMFQDEVYFNGMERVLDTLEFCDMSGQFGTVKVLCAKVCGYKRIMLEDSSSYIKFQLSPRSNHMSVLDQQGTLPHIRNLVRTVVRMWREKPELRAYLFTPDKNVSVA